MFGTLQPPRAEVEWGMVGSRQSLPQRCGDAGFLSFLIGRGMLADEGFAEIGIRHGEWAGLGCRNAATVDPPGDETPDERLQVVMAR